MWLVAAGLDNTVPENSEPSLQASGTIFSDPTTGMKQEAAQDKAGHVIVVQERKTPVTGLDVFRTNSRLPSKTGKCLQYVWAHRCLDSREEATMLTTIEEEVLELCTRTVTRTPITIPATGLDIMELLLKNCPATFPEENKCTVWNVRWAVGIR